MRTHPRKHSDATQSTAEILKETAKPRQPASVKEYLEKNSPASVATKTPGGNKSGKARVSRMTHRDP